MQMVSCVVAEAKVQHSGFFGSEQSAFAWQSTTFVVSVQLEPRCVGHAAGAVHEVSRVAGVQFGYVPAPLVVATPQHTGVDPLQSPGPPHVIVSLAVQLEGATQAK